MKDGGEGTKKAFFLMLAVVCAVAFCVTGECAEKRTSAKKVVRAKRMSPKKTKDILEHKRIELERSDWSLRLVAPSGAGEQKTDTLIFKDSRFTSNAFLAKGFAPTNYTLTVQDDGVVVFETMQVSEKEGTVFWRGEFEEADHVIRGMVGQVLPNQNRADLSFLGTQQPSASDKAEKSINPDN